MMVEIWDGESVIQLIMDAMDSKLWAKWEKERVALYRKFEPTGALLDAAPRHVQGVTPTRLVLGEETSATMWNLLCASTGQGPKALLETLQQKTLEEQQSLLQKHSKLNLAGPPDVYKVPELGLPTL